MADKVLEEILKQFLSKHNEEEEGRIHLNKVVLHNFEKSSVSSSTAAITSAGAATCTLEEFAIYYLGLVKSQTDEFIKSNTSTCNTPHKILQFNAAAAETVTDVVTDPLLHDDNKKIITTENVGGGGSESSLQQQHANMQSDGINSSNNDNCKSGKGEMRFTKRQISRELFIVNADGNQCRDKSDSDNNHHHRVGNNESKGRINLNQSGGKSGSTRQFRKIFTDSTLPSSPFQVIESPNFGNCEHPITAGTPSNLMTRKINHSMDGSSTPTNTSTPNSFFHNTRNSLSFDSTTNRGNSSRKSFDISSGHKSSNNTTTNNNSSSNRRNTSSPFCLGDFINTSNTSNKGNKKKNQSAAASTPKFSTLDFPALNQNTTNDSIEVKMQQQQQPKGNINNNNKTSETTAAASKPKKRVMPITVSRKASTETPNFISSSFQSENNLLNVTTLEADDESFQRMPERALLREHRDAISKDFGNEHKPTRNLHALIRENLPASPLQSQQFSSTPHKLALEYDETRVDRQDVLIIMAKIYSFLIDANYVPNILSEFSYIVNLLNTEHNPYEHQSQNHTQMKTYNDIAAHLLKNYHNCIFFAICVLNHQKQILGMLDCTTIRVICDGERIRKTMPALYDYLRNVMQKKMQMDTLMSSQKGRSDASDVNKVVFYQQETDNRDNFPSDREFGAFKKQRDMFYAILRSWELKHLDPSWDFRKDLGAKVRGLLTLLEHPINMAHLAKLFTAQLIISCNFDNELQMALPNVDLSKLSKLRQRLVAPSSFSTQYLFPGNQAFFRDFIICCDFHMMFIEQLKIALISELAQMNDSSMETLSITRGNNHTDATAADAASSTTVDDDDDNKENSFRQEFIVRGETISTMRVIGKFIGFVVSRSYSYDGYRNSLVDQKQMSIRNLIHPDFDVKSIVTRAIDGRKLLVTIPWLVEYLAMLDFITIRLDYYRELFRMLFTIYMSVNVVDDGHASDDGFCVMPQSKFIVRACLGWLFEHPRVPEDYFNANMMLANFYQSKSSAALDVDATTTTTHVRKKKNNSNVLLADQLNPHLESIIHTACPFLADFRVSMMPQRNRMTKAVSRTGRYRHITTKMQDKISDSSSGNAKTQGNHERLVEAFLASQSLSVRKIVDFTIDRVSSACIKDFQMRHLLTVRKEARTAVECEVPSMKSVDDLKNKMREVFYQHLVRLHALWTEDVSSNSRKRIEATFDALLPVETLNDVKTTLINITIEKTIQKLELWRGANISVDIFSKDIQVDAMKLMESNCNSNVTVTNKRTSQNMIIDLSAGIHPSDYFQKLQKYLYRASQHPQMMKLEDVLKLLELSENILDKQTLPTNAYRNVAFYLLQLVLLLIANSPELITKELLAKLFIVWQHEKLSNFTSIQRNEDEEDETDYGDDDEEKIHLKTSQQHNRLKVNNFVFCNVISSRFMIMMKGKDRRNFQVYGNFLIELIKAKFITVDDINELSVGLYKYEWSKDTLDDIAFLVQHVKSFLPSPSSSGSQENAQSHLFLELVADLARDMENF